MRTLGEDLRAARLHHERHRLRSDRRRARRSLRRRRPTWRRALIRAVGDPLERFREDGLRAMRAVRFAAQLEFALDPGDRGAPSPRRSTSSSKVSAERVRDELVKILVARRGRRSGCELHAHDGPPRLSIPELLEGVGMHQNRFHKHDVWQHTLAAVDARRSAARSAVAGAHGGAAPRRGQAAHRGAQSGRARREHLLSPRARRRRDGRRDRAPPQAVDAGARARRQPGRQPHVLVHARVERRRRCAASSAASGAERRRRLCSRCAPATCARAATARSRASRSTSSSAASPSSAAEARAQDHRPRRRRRRRHARSLGCRPGPIIGEVLRRAARARARRPRAQQRDSCAR